MKTAYLALGTNLGDRAQNLANARRQLASEQVRVARESSIYETEPRYLRDQPWFLNQVVEIETDLFPRQLFALVKKTERALGRQPAQPNGPRAIDIDILFFGGAVVNTPDLEIPHPRMGERRFVLEPLVEIAPDLRHPVTGRTVREMLADVKDQAVRKIDPGNGAGGA
jgi:2-amino-4-hydroxy-6-hydroxymethyldihydropteridine diphosphokinase